MGGKKKVRDRLVSMKVKIMKEGFCCLHVACENIYKQFLMNSVLEETFVQIAIISTPIIPDSKLCWVNIGQCLANAYTIVGPIQCANWYGCQVTKQLSQLP